MAGHRMVADCRTLVGGKAREPCKAMEHDGRETGHGGKDHATSQMVVVVEGEIAIELGF